MREVYQIIRDRQALEDFVQWLPDTGENERFYLSLQARKKYVPTLTHQLQVRRFICRKDNLISHIEQLECPVGCYKTKDGEVIPTEALALYITCNPRDLDKATFMAAKGMIDLLQNNGGNPYSEALACIHKSKGKTRWVQFDIDYKGKEEFFGEVATVIGRQAMTVIETRGGYHLMIDPAKVVSNIKNWYGEITKKFEHDQSGDLMTPVVGCVQGDFSPKFVYR